MNNDLNIKIAFFDIDGTLTNSNRVMSSRTINTLNMLIKKGIEVVICSGRGNSYIYNLIKNIDTPKYSISSDGAEIYNNHTKTNVFASKVDYETILKYYKYAADNNLQIILNTENARYVNYIINKNIDTILINDIEDLKNINVYSFILVGNDYNKMLELEKNIEKCNDIYIVHFSNDYLNKKNIGDHWFDIVNKSVNKGNAINYLLHELNIDKKNAICFGDSMNDIDMFDACGIKVAMGNALDNLKEKADYITDTNDNDGISEFFDKIYKK